MTVYHTIGTRKLQDWHSIRIEVRDGSKVVIFTSRIHKNKEVELSYCFSTKFTDYEILNDHNVMTSFINMYGVDAMR